MQLDVAIKVVVITNVLLDISCSSVESCQSKDLLEAILKVNVYNSYTFVTFIHTYLHVIYLISDILYINDRIIINISL